MFIRHHRRGASFRKLSAAVIETLESRCLLSATANFLAVDSAASGNWIGKYGADGYSIPQASTNLPAYASLSTTGTPTNWTLSTSDTRALQNPATPSDHTATAWYSQFGFTLNAAATDGNAHQLSLYAVDFDHGGRSETFVVKDGDTGATLDTEALSSFSGGKYLSWNVSGNVEIDVATVAGSNSVVSGVFFDPASTQPVLSATAGDSQASLSWAAVPGASSYNLYRSTTAGGEGATPFLSGLTGTSYTDASLINGTRYYYRLSSVTSAGESTQSVEASALPFSSAPATATFLGGDAATAGNWIGIYGGDGQAIANLPSNVPASDTFSASGANLVSWQNPTTDTRALQTPDGSSRLASAWYANSMQFHVDFADGQTHRLVLYALDFDHGGRAETISLTDAASGTTLDSQSLSNFSGGQYLAWNVSGNVTVSVASNVVQNAVISGVFFDPQGTVNAPTNVTVLPSVSEADVTWQSSLTNGLYSVLRTDSSGNTVQVGSAISTTTYQDTTVVNGQSYTYAVKATSSAGTSSSSTPSASATPGGAWVPVTDSSGNTITVTPDILSAAISDFGAVTLAAGTYRVDYTGGIMTYSGPQSGNQGYRVNAWRDGGYGFEVAQNDAANSSSDLHAPGTDVENASPSQANGQAFSSAGGTIGVYLHDSPYGDNAGNGSAATPTFTLERLIPAVSVTAIQDGYDDAKKPVIFQINRTGDSSQSLAVYYTLGGSAIPGTADSQGVPTPAEADYTGAVLSDQPGMYSVTIPAGQQSTPLVLTPLDDKGAQPLRTVSIQLQSPPANVGGVPPYFADPTSGPTTGPSATQPSTQASANLHGLTVQIASAKDTKAGAPSAEAIKTQLDLMDAENPDVRAAAQTQVSTWVTDFPSTAQYIAKAYFTDDSLTPEGKTSVHNILHDHYPVYVTFDGNVMHMTILNDSLLSVQVSSYGVPDAPFIAGKDGKPHLIIEQTPPAEEGPLPDITVIPHRTGTSFLSINAAHPLDDPEPSTKEYMVITITNN